MKTYPLCCRQGGLKKNLFNVQGTVNNSSARAMNSAEKNNFLVKVVQAISQAAQGIGFSPCKFV